MQFSSNFSACFYIQIIAYSEKCDYNKFYELKLEVENHEF